MNGIIIKFSFDFDTLQPGKLVCDNSFAADVPFVFNQYFCSLDNFFFAFCDFVEYPFECRHMFGYIFYCDLRTVY